MILKIALLQTGKTMFGVKAAVAETDSVSESWPNVCSQRILLGQHEARAFT